MIRNYQDLTRYEMEQVDRANTIVLIPLGALEQHGSQAPLGTDLLLPGRTVSLRGVHAPLYCAFGIICRRSHGRVPADPDPDRSGS